eukprot:m.96571 g.96571  ORF g.96571 m.96571 type:complete len:107 (-) comp15055_c0_seq8:151-471(-)
MADKSFTGLDLYTCRFSPSLNMEHVYMHPCVDPLLPHTQLVQAVSSTLSPFLQYQLSHSLWDEKEEHFAHPTAGPVPIADVTHSADESDGDLLTGASFKLHNYKLL